MLCPVDGGEILEKRSKKGRVFYGCGNWPECDWVSWNRPIPEPCPECGGLQVEMGRGKLRCLKHEGEPRRERVERVLVERDPPGEALEPAVAEVRLRRHEVARRRVGHVAAQRNSGVHHGPRDVRRRAQSRVPDDIKVCEPGEAKGIAKAILHRPSLLVLDEPTASLDPDIALRVRTALREISDTGGAALLVTSHNMVEVERLCERVVFLSAGRVVADGTPDEITERFGRDDLEGVFLHLAELRDREGALR